MRGDPTYGAAVVRAPEHKAVDLTGGKQLPRDHLDDRRRHPRGPYQRPDPSPVLPDEPDHLHRPVLHDEEADVLWDGYAAREDVRASGVHDVNGACARGGADRKQAGNERHGTTNSTRAIAGRVEPARRKAGRSAPSSKASLASSR